MAAAKTGQNKMVLSLLDSGADIGIGDPGKNTALMKAVIAGQLKNVLSLIKHGANVVKKNFDGDAALLRAVQGGHSDVVLSLLEHKADTDIQDKTETALTLAVREGHEDVVKSLLKYDADAAMATKAAIVNGDTEKNYEKSTLGVIAHAIVFRVRSDARDRQPGARRSF